MEHSSADPRCGEIIEGWLCSVVVFTGWSGEQFHNSREIQYW